MNKMRFIIAILMSLVVGLSHAGIETYSERIEGGAITPGSSDVTVQDDKYYDMLTNPAWPTVFTNHEVKNFVRLGINPDVPQTADYTGTVDVIVTYETWNGTTFVTNVENRTLSLNYATNGQLLVDDQSTFTFSGGHFVNVRIGAINGLNVNDIYVEAIVEVERYYFMNVLQVPFVDDQPVPMGTNYNQAGNEFIEIYWPYHLGAESYELEWVHVNDYDYTYLLDGTPSLTAIPQSALNYDFYLNSTRVEVSGNSYRVPNIFDRGYFIYRVRPIGREGANFQDRLDGEWSALESGTIASFPTDNKIYIDRQYDPGMNWAHQVGYTEEGKRFESVSFVDGLGRGRQTVARNTETEQVVVSNVYYDDMGRPVISDLPTPQNEDFPRHYMDFNYAEGTTESYRSEYFDASQVADNCALDSKGMSTSRGAGKYYSSQNPDQDGANANIPDAENFPFTRVTYKDDFTGRVDRIAGAGETLKMGNNHETRMIYVSPNQAELNQLFGVEVGNASHYQKMVTVDPNGQVYVHYMDMAGRIVTTYMTGESPENLVPLAQAQVNGTYINELLGDSGQDQNIDLSVPSATLTYTQYFAESAGAYTFNYSFSPQQFQDSCMAALTCFDCVYDLSISIIDECGAAIIVPNPTIQINGGTLDELCNGVASPHAIPSFTVEIPQGTYTITKTLTVNQDAINDYWCMYVDNLTEACLPPLDNLFNALYAQEAFEDCNPQTLGDLSNQTDCEARYSLMLNDVSPGGQYALYTVSNGVYSATDATSIFNPALPHQWWNGTFLDESGNSVTFTQNDLGLFIESFRDEWANELVQYHPEACYYTGMCDNPDIQASYDYDQAMLNTYTYNDACQQGFISPVGGVPSIPSLVASSLFYNCPNTNDDPFFTGIGSAYSSSIKTGVFSGTSLTTAGLGTFIQVDGTNYSLWEYIMAMIANPNATTSAQIDIAITSFDKVCDMDLFWIRFRDAYLDLKSQYYQQYQEAYAQANCPITNIGLPGAGAYADKTPIFPSVAYMNNQINQTSTQYGGSGNINTGSQTSMNGFVNGTMLNQQCQSSCDAYADDWIESLAGCAQYVDPNTNQLVYGILPADVTNLKAAFVNLCMSGCDADHPGGISAISNTAGSTSYGYTEPITGASSIQGILSSSLFNNGQGYSETTLCTEWLISEPAPYDNAITVTENHLTVPLDTCACDAIYQAQYDLNNGSFPTGTTLEQVLAINTGVDLDDAHYLICDCDEGVRKSGPSAVWSPSFVWHPDANDELEGQVTAELACAESQGCVTCTTLLPHTTTIASDFGLATVEDLLNEENGALILTNYLNDQLNFHQNVTNYVDFIRGCNAVAPAPPYCTVNPVLEQLNDVMKLIAFRGQLTSSTTIDLTQENIVYANRSLEDDGIGKYYSAALNGNQLTASFSDGANACNLTMTLPTGASFGFDDILSFEAVYPSSFECDDNYAYEAEITYIDCGVVTTGTISVVSSCFEVNLCVCGDEGQVLCDEPYLTVSEECYQPVLDQLYQASIEQFESNVQEQYTYFASEYNKKCAEAFGTEKFEYIGPDRHYQFTLFYYDQSGNLARTIAPEGVDLLANGDNALIEGHKSSVQSSTVYTSPTAGTTRPNQTYETRYDYNSYGQLTSTTNPDQNGNTEFWYDRYGRIIASQNPVQAQNLQYSYTFYDAQGRPVEVGQMSRNVPGDPQPGGGGTAGYTVNAFTEQDIKQDDLGVWFKNWISSGFRTEVTITQYDEYPAGVAAKFDQTPNERALRLRVASVKYFTAMNSSTNLDTDYESATHYSYDLHGNVIEQIQDVPALKPVEQDLKSTQYAFELISGNVEKVEYQKGERDAMTHEYVYDDLNRLTEVLTSSDNVHQSREAHYYYYDYGPLARTELGQYKVQGQDFAYTINGWIKGLNASTLNVSRDMGKDGTTGYLSTNAAVHSGVAKDINAYTMGYFTGDYRAISTLSAMEMTATSNDAFQQATRDLYNGNIRHIVTSIYGVSTIGSSYSYDQLQRLKKMTGFYNINSGNNWTGMTATEDYYNAYTYDRNGNIQTLQRNGTAGTNSLAMDNFAYNYATGKNQLRNVQDGVTTTGSLLLGDIQHGQSTGDNYTYDNIGQLLGDASEEIAAIDWRKGDKKIYRITRASTSSQPDLEFVYNPFGIRVLKIEKIKSSPGVIGNQRDWKYTYYAYDANGQCMGVYDVSLSSSNNQAYLAEHHLFGASRLGMIKHNRLIYDNDNLIPPVGDVVQNTLGLKRFELTNHLGNVQAVITDRKTPEALTTVDHSSFTSGLDGWQQCNQVTISHNAVNGLMNVNTTTSGNCVFKMMNTIPGESYTVNILANHGTAPDLKLHLFSIGDYSIADGVLTQITFVANSAQTGLIISTTDMNSNYSYSIDDVLMYATPEYEAVVKMTSDYYPFGMVMPDACDDNGNQLVESVSYTNTFTQDFSNASELSNWTTYPGNDPTTTKSVSNGVFTMEATALNDHAERSLPVTSGTEYRLTFDANDQLLGGVFIVYAGGVSGNPILTMQPIVQGANVFTFTAPSNDVRFQIKECGTPISSTNITIDNLVLDQITTTTTQVACLGYIHEDGYRFAYNGMEQDNEVSGNGNSYTTEFRQYDSRLGRWKSLDPLRGYFPWQSPYVAFDNNPIYYVDPYGLSSDGPGEPTTFDRTASGVSFHKDEKFRIDQLEGIVDAASNGDVIFIYKTTNGTKTYRYSYNESTKSWDETQRHDQGRSVFNSNKYEGSAKNRMNSLENQIVTRVDDASKVGDMSTITRGAIEVNEGIIHVPEKSYRSGGESVDERFISKNGNDKRLYQESGSLVKDTKGTRLHKKIDAFDNALKPLGPITDAAELGYNIVEGNWGAVTEKVIIMGFDQVANRLMMTPTPATVALGVVIKGAIFIYENWDAFKSAFSWLTKPAPVMGPANPPAVDYGGHYDNLDPTYYTPKVPELPNPNIGFY